MKIFIVLFILIIGTNLTLYADSVDSEEALPKDWYTLPEDRDAESKNYDVSALTESQENALDRLFSVNASAFDKMEEQYTGMREKKWRMEACMLDLTLSLSGVLGVLVAKGDATASLYWKKNQPKEETANLETMDAAFSTDDSREGIVIQIEPIIKAVIASQGVKDEVAFRKNLTSKLMEYHELLQYITVNPSLSWQVSRFRVDFSFDISGKVNAVTTVGGGARLRFEWHLVPKSNSLTQTLPHSRAGDNLRKLVENLATQVTEAKLLSTTASGFELKTIKLGIGVFGEGNFGVIKASMSLWGYLYLSPNLSRNNTVVVKHYESVPLVTDLYTENEKEWIRVNSIVFENFRSQKGDSVKVISAASETFQRGLQRAQKIGQTLADRAAKHERKWKVYQLKLEFVLSLSGSVGMVKIGGAGAIEFEFQKS